MTVEALAPTLDWRSYVDADAFPMERDRCFAGAWHYVGHHAGLESVGAQRACSALDVPVLLVRGAGADGSPGALRAFVNACRHRGARLVEREACARSITCPYHGWTYGLDGALRGAPLLAGETGQSPAALAVERSLHELRLESWGPLLFVALDAAAQPLLEWLGPIPARAAAMGVDVDRLVSRHRVDGESACNWKVACENYLECYHCRIAHRDFCDVVDVREGAYQLEVHGGVAVQVAPRREDAERRAGYDGSGRVDRGEFWFVFPNLVAYATPGAPILAIGPVVPRAVDRTWRSLEYLAEPSLVDDRIAELVAWDERVGEEDRVLVEAVQAGMGAWPVIADGVTLPSSERLVGWFADRVRAATS